MILSTLIQAGKDLGAAGLIRGSAGNFSIRYEQDGVAGLLLTPSGLDCTRLLAQDFVFLGFDGQRLAADTRQPTSEWRIHRDILAFRSEFGAVIHTHAPFATALACLQQEIPAFHYMIARFGGSTIRCAAYAAFGTQALSDAALCSLQDRSACLLANHGMLVCADDIAHAVALAVEFEDLCAQYWRACCIGKPVLLSEMDMQTVLQRFSHYGQLSDNG